MSEPIPEAPTRAQIGKVVEEAYDGLTNSEAVLAARADVGQLVDAIRNGTGAEDLEGPLEGLPAAQRHLDIAHDAIEDARRALREVARNTDTLSQLIDPPGKRGRRI